MIPLTQSCSAAATLDTSVYMGKEQEPYTAALPRLHLARNGPKSDASMGDSSAFSISSIPASCETHSSLPQEQLPISVVLLGYSLGRARNSHSLPINTAAFHLLQKKGKHAAPWGHSVAIPLAKLARDLTFLHITVAPRCHQTGNCCSKTCFSGAPPGEILKPLE